MPTKSREWQKDSIESMSHTRKTVSNINGICRSENNNYNSHNCPVDRKELNGQRTSTLELLDCCEGCCVVMLCYVSPWYHINQRLTIVQPAAAREEVTGLRNLRDALVR
jgi:hypothetical protein